MVTAAANGTVEVAEGGPPNAPIKIVDTLAFKRLELKYRGWPFFNFVFTPEFLFVCHLAVQEVELSHVDAESLLSVGGVMMTARFSSRDVHVPTGNFLGG